MVKYSFRWWGELCDNSPATREHAFFYGRKFKNYCGTHVHKAKLMLSRKFTAWLWKYSVVNSGSETRDIQKKNPKRLPHPKVIFGFPVADIWK